MPEFGKPAERRAQFWVPNVPRSWISERAPFRIYEHSQCRVFERTPLQCAYVIPCRQQMGSSAVLRARVLEVWTGVASVLALWRQGQTSTCISSVSFVRNESNFFTIHRRHRRKKMMDQNFEIWIQWFFKNFWKFSQRRHAVPLRPVWTIMVAAKLD